WSTRVMSISHTVETWAEVLLERTMCSAVFLRMGDIGTTSTRSPAWDGAAAGAAALVARGCGAGSEGTVGVAAGSGRVSMWRRMSFLVTGAEMPVPWICGMSTLCSAGMRRTTGDDRVCRSSSAVISEAARAGEGAEGGGGAGDGAEKAEGAGAGGRGAGCGAGGGGWGAAARVGA